MPHPVPGLDKHPDLMRRYNAKVNTLYTGDGKCRGCGLGGINDEFSRAVAKRLKRDNARRKK